jgi:hypothetical protein
MLPINTEDVSNDSKDDMTPLYTPVQQLYTRKLMEVSTMKNSRLYLFLALFVIVTLAVIPGCSTVITPGAALVVPVVPASPAAITSNVPAPAKAPVTGSADLAITKVWLDGVMINYTVKNVGTADSVPTNTYIYVNDMLPAMGGDSYVDVLKPGEQRTLYFTNYQWPYDNNLIEIQGRVQSEGYIKLPLNNNKVTVCTNVANAANETVTSNNCKITLVGMLWDYDLLSVSTMATWRNGNGDMAESGSVNNANGAHLQIANNYMETTPQLEMIPQQVPQGWMQGTWGYFYSDPEYHSPKIAAIEIPAKLHFISRVGLSRDAVGSDGVTFRLGLRDLNDTVTWVGSKTVSTPGAFEDWDINLSAYEGQKDCFLLRVDAGASPTNDFAIWNQARLAQVND